MDPIYLISNVHRSGSSMMMRCLIAGGLVGVYNTDLDNQLFQDGYHPNPHGFYENPVSDRDLLEYSNKVTKYPFRMLLDLPIGNYKIILLKRNPEEIFNSMLNFTPYTSWGRDMVVLEFYDEIFNHIIDVLNVREDVTLTVLNYIDIINNPLVEFNKLVDNGWPIDATAAALLVDDSLHRLKLESDGE